MQENPNKQQRKVFDSHILVKVWHKSQYLIDLTNNAHWCYTIIRKQKIEWKQGDTIVIVIRIESKRNTNRKNYLNSLFLFIGKKWKWNVGKMIVVIFKGRDETQLPIFPKFILQGTLSEERNSCSTTPIHTIPAQDNALFSYSTQIVSTYTIWNWFTLLSRIYHTGIRA